MKPGTVAEYSLDDWFLNVHDEDDRLTADVSANEKQTRYLMTIIIELN